MYLLVWDLYLCTLKLLYCFVRGFLENNQDILQEIWSCQKVCFSFILISKTRFSKQYFILSVNYTTQQLEILIKTTAGNKDGWTVLIMIAINCYLTERLNLFLLLHYCVGVWGGGGGVGHILSPFTSVILELYRENLPLSNRNLSHSKGIMRGKSRAEEEREVVVPPFIFPSAGRNRSYRHYLTCTRRLFSCNTSHTLLSTPLHSLASATAARQCRQVITR